MGFFSTLSEVMVEVRALLDSASTSFTFHKCNPKSKVIFSLDTNHYIFQAENLQNNYILLARGTVICTYTTAESIFNFLATFLPLFLRVHVLHLHNSSVIFQQILF